MCRKPIEVWGSRFPLGGRAGAADRQFSDVRNDQDMKFAEFIRKDAIRPELEAVDKEAVIREMAGALMQAGSISDDQFESVVEAILKREELGSTGIGRGVAVPHTKHPTVDRLCGAVAVSQSGVEFDSLDGEKVHLLFLLVSPPDRPGDHLRALENISRQLRNDTFCRFLKQAKTAEDVWQLLEEADNNQFGA
jgi:fructose-specific phosphotransferase system IIA component